jgi:hypothetical protein
VIGAGCMSVPKQDCGDSCTIPHIN